MLYLRRSWFNLIKCKQPFVQNVSLSTSYVYILICCDDPFQALNITFTSPGPFGWPKGYPKVRLCYLFVIPLNLCQQGAIWLILLWAEVEKTNYWYTITIPSYFVIPKSFAFEFTLLGSESVTDACVVCQEKDPAGEENPNHRLGGVFVVPQMVSIVSKLICKSKNAILN